jgi:hypothetical protein
MGNFIRLCLYACLALVPLAASEYKGVVKFGGLPLPGATITATQDDKKLAVLSDQQGAYTFPDLADGGWTIQVEMLCFATVKSVVVVAAGAPASEWEMKLLPMAEIQAAAGPPKPPTVALAPKVATAAPVPALDKKGRPNKNAPLAPTNTPGAFQRTGLNANASAAPATPPPSDQVGGDAATDLSQKAADGFLINGTVNNGASSPFALGPAFGNNRRGGRSLYNGGLSLILDNSSLDAQSFSLTGQNTPKPSYTHLTGGLTFGGPLKIPHLLRNGPNIFIGYQWTRNRTSSTGSGLVPTALERIGDFSQSLNAAGKPVQTQFAGNMIPQSLISPQAKVLLRLFPLPNFNSDRYNYQVPLVGATHQDSLNTRANKAIGRKNQIAGSFNYQSIRTDTANLFGFLDTGDSSGINATVNWRHTFTPRIFGNLGVSFSRLSTSNAPFFANRENVSGEAGISGNNQEAANWGPPTLNFAGGLSPLTDGQPSVIKNQTTGASYSLLWNRARHNFTFGGDVRKQQFNYNSQQDPRGSFTFTGAAAGSDFAGFLLGIPDTSSIAFGNADKYLRASNYDAYVNDDWRINPSLTLNIGLRWEYWSPITELYGRLVNLDIAPGFTAIAPVVANKPMGSATGQQYPDSLVQPDKRAFQPRAAFSWRPFAASSMVVRGGYGVYYNTSVYQPLAIQMAQQSPLSKNLSVQNTQANPLTLANGFNAAGSTPNTFALDPNFRVGYLQNWQLSVQRDLPGSLVMTATYLGSKGTRGMQEFLPNTYPDHAVNPSGFAFLTSNGNSTREAGQLQLRRRLHNGITASLNYTYSKAIDDSSLGGKNQGGYLIAQNWLDLSAERALSNFDQRHQLTLDAQYTSGMGIGGGTLVNGWRGALLKEWTVTSQITAASGFPLTPIYISAVRGTGVTGTLRPDYTGADLYAAPAGFHLNPAAFATPIAGQWGDAGRNSIRGPNQFLMSASLGRTFRLTDRFNADLRVDAANVLNHVTYPSWNTTANSAQFGLPMSANAMRSLQTTFRVRF